MTRTLLVEIIVVVLAIVVGYGGITFAQRGVRLPTSTPSPRPEPPTATVAPAVTFTPAPTVIPAPTTPTVVPTETVRPGTLPASPTSKPATKTPSPTPAPIAYVVQAGDSLDGISKKFGVSVNAIMQANHLSDPNSLSEGQKLIIPRK